MVKTVYSGAHTRVMDGAEEYNVKPAFFQCDRYIMEERLGASVTQVAMDSLILLVNSKWQLVRHESEETIFSHTAENVLILSDVIWMVVTLICLHK